MSDFIVEKDSDVFGAMTGDTLGARFSTKGDYQKDDALAKHVNRQLEAQPLINDACDGFIERIKAERREDIVVPVGDFRVDNAGRLVRRDGGPVASGLNGFDMLPQAWSQLCAKAPNDVDTRMKSNVNSWLHRKRAELVGRTFKPTADYTRGMFALVTERYQSHDADEIAAEIARVVPKECRGTIKYLDDGGRFEISAALGRPFDVKGDLHQIIISVRSSDNGTLGQQVHFKAFRLKCTNGIYVTQKSLICRTRHTGDRNSLRQQFSRGLGMATEAVESFQHLWGTAQDTKYVCAKTGETLNGAESLSRLVMHKKIAVPRNRPKALLEKVMASYEKEPGDSVADVLNAVTRTAHEGLGDERKQWFGDDLEEQAGGLLSRGELSLPPLTEEQREKLAK